MNKTQINHFEARMKRVVASILDRMGEELPLRDNLTRLEMAGLIASGKARFKEEKFTGPDCPWRPYLFDAFEYPGEDDIKGFNAARSALHAKTGAKIRKAADKLLDEFVLGRIDFDTAVEKLQAMKFWEKEA